MAPLILSFRFAEFVSYLFSAPAYFFTEAQIHSFCPYTCLIIFDIAFLASVVFFQLVYYFAVRYFKSVAFFM